jgi:hypothetical protein
MVYMPTQPVMQLITSCLYPQSADGAVAADDDVAMGDDSEQGTSTMPEAESGSGSSAQPLPYTDLRRPAPLAQMFEAEFCRRHGLPKEDLLSIAVDLGGKGGALAAIEKARKVMLLGDRMGNVREWDELPVCARLGQCGSRSRHRQWSRRNRTILPCSDSAYASIGGTTD